MRHRWADEDFIEAVRDNVSIAGVLRAIGLKVTGANYHTVHTYVEKFDLDTSHWTGQTTFRGGATAKPIEHYLVKGRRVGNTSCLKRRLISEKLLENECSICGLGSEWNGFPLVLVLDHISGERADNRLANLRLLCPNCNSQQPTFCRKKSYLRSKNDEREVTIG